MRTWLVLIMGTITLAGCAPDPQVQKVRDAFAAAEAKAPPMELSVLAYASLETFDSLPPASTHLSLLLKNKAYLQDYKGLKDGQIVFEETTSTPDGQTLYTVHGNEFYIRPAKQWQITHNIPVPFLTPVHSRPLKLALTEDDVKVAGTAQVDGASCQILEGTEKNVRPPMSYKLYLDPALGLMPRQIESFVNGQRKSTIRFKEYTELAPGSWFPKRVEVEPVNPPGQTRKRLALYLAEFKLQPDIPDSVFAPTPPPNARILDQR
jgi:hypothetical protein